jgi:hypothetical protein
LCGVTDGMAEQRFDGLEKRFGLEDHAFAAAEGTIINGAMAILGEFAEILDVNLDETRFSGAAEDAVVQRANEELRKNRDEIEAHG